jgi:peptidoglycan/xylan/chitin deacetylase (PgdA/CDA1 family)
LDDVEEVRQEIVRDKCRLESIIEKPVHYFAYPFGAQSNASVNLVGILADAGYRGAVTTVPGFQYKFFESIFVDAGSHRRPDANLRLQRSR